MSTDDLIAQFLARGGAVKKIPTGQASMSPREMHLAMGYEPEKTYAFEVLLMGEDGCEFMVHQSAGRKADALSIVQRAYPESLVISCELKGSRDERLYRDAFNSYYED